MEFYQELLLTAVVSFLLAIIVGKLAAIGDANASDPHASPEGTAAASDRDGRMSPVPAGGGAVSVKERRVRFQEISEEPVDDPRRAAEIPGSDPTEFSKVVGGDRPETEKSLSEVSVAMRSEDVILAELELVGEIADEKEIKKEMLETVEAEEVDGRLGGDEAVVEGMQEEECESEVVGGEKSSIDEEIGMEGSLLHGEDDWEGIERSELEERFAVAMACVDSVDGGNAMSRLSSDVQMQLYGLQKVAMEGPCYEPQPLALKVSARAKWHAWQRLGNMAQEVAMEQYIALLSNSIPGWMGEKRGGNYHQNECNDPREEHVTGTETSDPGSSLHSSRKIDIRLPKDSSPTEGDDSYVSPELSAQGISRTFFLNLLSPTTGRFLSFYW